MSHTSSADFVDPDSFLSSIRIFCHSNFDSTPFTRNKNSLLKIFYENTKKRAGETKTIILSNTVDIIITQQNTVQEFQENPNSTYHQHFDLNV